MERSSSDFINLLSPDAVDGFIYTKQCIYESLRCNPPGPSTMPSLFTEDIKIGGVLFKKNQTCFIVNIDAISHDPKEWIRPYEYNPDRFNPASEMYLRPDGKQRNPLAFCSFSGGKRICAGKTFAEIMLSLTVPLMYYHFDFEFTDPG